MQLSLQEAQGLVTSGVDALRHGRSADARRCFERVTETGRANAQVWLLLATACRATGDAAGEEAALDRLLAIEPGLLRAQLMKGDCRDRAGDEAGAMRFYEGALLAAEGQSLPEDLLAELRRAEARIAEAKLGAAERREAALAARGLPPEGRSARFRQSLDILAGRKRIYVQEPTGYYFPGLPQIQFFDRADFAWASEVEAATGAIRDELAGLLAERRERFRPYLLADHNRPRSDAANPMLDSADWSALFLCENGAEDADAIAQAPRTWAAMQRVPAPRIANSPTVMFSLLKPGARIAAHTGMFNTRLVCHLPLVVPPGCGFRVGNEVREWREGELIIFDDTIEHEAWNEGDSDRIVLIFDIWRPELSAQERREVAALLAGPMPR